MWDRVFELILRLKGNAVIVGTAAFPDERSMALATRRGQVPLFCLYDLKLIAAS
jgi:hypothetical protein